MLSTCAYHTSWGFTVSLVYTTVDSNVVICHPHFLCQCTTMLTPTQMRMPKHNTYAQYYNEVLLTKLTAPPFTNCNGIILPFTESIPYMESCNALVNVDRGSLAPSNWNRILDQLLITSSQMSSMMTPPRLSSLPVASKPSIEDTKNAKTPPILPESNIASNDSGTSNNDDESTNGDSKPSARPKGNVASDATNDSQGCISLLMTSNEDTVFQDILCQLNIVEFPTLDDVGSAFEAFEKKSGNRLSIQRSLIGEFRL